MPKASGTQSPTPTPTPTEEWFPGYPRLVSINSIDKRVKGWIQRNFDGDTLVAIAPAAYVPYTGTVKDLDFYIENPGKIYGDCTIIKYIWKYSSYSCDAGIMPGSDEPKS